MNKAVDVQDAFGKTFCVARIKADLSLEQVATELNMLKRHVEAIEKESFGDLPQKAFVRGFVLNYARLLGLDSNEMLRRFEEVYPKQADLQPTVATAPMGELKRSTQSPIRLNIGLVLGIGAVLVVGLILLKMITSSKSNTAYEAQQTAQNLTASEQAQGAALDNNPLGATGSALSGTTVATTGSVLTNGIIDFWVKESTVISVKDAKGATLMSGSQGRGGYQITGESPFEVVITNPAKVDVSYNHEKVDLTAHTQGDKAVLSLK